MVDFVKARLQIVESLADAELHAIRKFFPTSPEFDRIRQFKFDLHMSKSHCEPQLSSHQHVLARVANTGVSINAIQLLHRVIDQAYKELGVTELRFLADWRVWLQEQRDARAIALTACLQNEAAIGAELMYFFQDEWHAFSLLHMFKKDIYEHGQHYTDEETKLLHRAYAIVVDQMRCFVSCASGRDLPVEDGVWWSLVQGRCGDAGSRWWPLYEGTDRTQDRIGDHLVARYRNVVVHTQRRVKLKHKSILRRYELASGGISLMDELSPYEKEECCWMKLAQTGHCLDLIEAFDRWITSAAGFAGYQEEDEHRDWRSALNRERKERVDFYNALLSDGKADTFTALARDDQWCLAFLTTLQYDYDRFEHKLLEREKELLATVFATVLTIAGLVVVTISDWFKPSMVRKGESANDFRPNEQSTMWQHAHITLRFVENRDGFAEEQCVRQAQLVNALHPHPHIAFFVGACHVAQPWPAFENADSEPLIQIFNERRLWRHLYQVALGVKYLHKRALHIDDLLHSDVVLVHKYAKMLSLRVAALSTDTVDVRTGRRQVVALGQMISDAIRQIWATHEPYRKTQSDREAADQQQLKRFWEPMMDFVANMCDHSTAAELDLDDVVCKFRQFAECEEQVDKESGTRDSGTTVHSDRADLSEKSPARVAKRLEELAADLERVSREVMPPGAQRVYARLRNVYDQLADGSAERSFNAVEAVHDAVYELQALFRPW